MSEGVNKPSPPFIFLFFLSTEFLLGRAMSLVPRIWGGNKGQGARPRRGLIPSRAYFSAMGERLVGEWSLSEQLFE